MKIVAICACTVGIAHTFMAEEKLKKEAEKRGYEIHVETQGALGIENRLSKEDIENANVVVFAVDAKITELERFDNKKVLEFSTSEVIHNIDKVMNEIEKIK